jgi:ribonuclease Y
MGAMAAELGLDVAIAKRIGLFHDIGKAIGHEVEGAHAVVGSEVMRRHGESPIVCNGVASHHGEVEAESVYGVLASAADAISASRPGARAESTAMYIRRLQQLEEISHSFEGVREAYAIQAGREIRVIVEPDQLNDDQAAMLARALSQKIEQGLQYPGQIQVTVIRETRAVAHAH